MIQIRSCVFETNSSSTHSLAIPFHCETPRYISFRIDQFGWEFEEADAADYFYTAIYEVSRTIEEVDEKIAKLKDILTSHGIEFDLGEVNCTCHDDWFYLNDGGIDHAGDLVDFVEELLSDGDKLIRFLGGGLVFTGNDNDYDNGFISRNEEFVTDYNWKSDTIIHNPNPYYMHDCGDYEWHYKGN